MASASGIVKDSVIEFRHINHSFPQYARLCAPCAIELSDDEQIEGLPEIYYAKAAPTHDPLAIASTHRSCGELFGSLGATIRHGGDAYYPQELDYFQMPPSEAFRDAKSHYRHSRTNSCA